MSTASRSRIIEDAHDQTKLKVSLPGGQYQLSVDDGGEILLFNEMGYSLRDTVPDTVVKVLVAEGDAWFPNERDYQRVIEDLPETQPISNSERDQLAEFLRSKRVSEARIDAVREVIANSSLQRVIGPDEVEVKELPEPPAGIFDEETGLEEESDTTTTPDTATERTTGTSIAGVQEPPSPSPEDVIDEITANGNASPSRVEQNLERLLERNVTLNDAAESLRLRFAPDSSEETVFDIPGVGVIRGHHLRTAGYEFADEVAQERPVDLAEISGVSDNVSTAIVEGARELTAREESTATQLARQTGRPADEFDSALSQLAPAGIPPSGASGTLRELYGPSVSEIPGVDARMAYFLFEAGYKTPWDVARASTAELEDVEYLGPTTAEKAIENAQGMISE